MLRKRIIQREKIYLISNNITNNFMTMKTKPKRSPVALTVLALLYEEPMHPYKMWQLIKERAKDEVVNVKYRNTMYQTIDRLLRDGLIAEKENRQEKNRPEQTIYEITDNGKKTAIQWMRVMVAELSDEYPEFPVALAFLPMLKVDEVKVLLQKRSDKLSDKCKQLEQQLSEFGDQIPRLFLLETEFVLKKMQCEKAWVDELIYDLHEKKLHWSDEWLREIAEQFKNSNH
jgi:DNA-binding PadR family transcriptional regulator